MGNHPWENTEDYTGHNKEGNWDYAQPFIIQMSENKWQKSLSLLPSASCVFRHNIWEESVSKGQQMCTCICHRFWIIASRSKGHEALLLLFAWNGVLSAFVCKNPRIWSKVSFIRSSKMLHVSWNSESQMILGQMLQKERLKSLRKGIVISCYSQEHLNGKTRWS